MAGPINAIATFFFAGSDGGDIGWTENWYVQGNDVDACLQTANTYKNPRIKVLHKDWFLETIRVSDLAVLGDSRESQFYPAQSRGESTSGESEKADVCIYMRMEGGSSRRRMFPLRGIPQGQMLKDGTVRFDGSFLNAMNAYIRWWGNNKGTLLVQKRQRDPGVPCTILPAASDPRKIIITPDTMPGGLTPGKLIQVGGIPQSAAYGFNGFWFIDSPGVTTITTKPKRKKYTLGTATGARLYIPTVSYLSVDSVIAQMGGTRKTGRPFGSPRGKLSATRH